MHVIVKPWTRAHLAVKAPNDNLTCLKRYESVDNTISKECYQKISEHLGNLSEELVALALCDNSIPIEEKRQMLLSMNTVYGDEEHVKRIKIDSETLHEKDILCFTETLYF